MRVVRESRRAGGLALVTGLLAVAVPLLAPVGPAGADPGPAPPSRQRTILNDVHTDAVDIQYVDGQLRLQTRVGSPPFEFFPASDVLFQLKDIEDGSRFAIPDIPEFAFLGPVGDPVWIAPETQSPGLVWPGWDAEGIPRGVLAGDAVDLRLVSVAGPGRVEVFLSDPLGLPIRVFSSQDPALRTVRQPVGSGAHVHASWAFSALGRYELTFEATGADASGRPLSSGPVTYAWYIGGTQAGDVVAEPSSAALSVSPPSAQVGQQVTLTGSVTPAAAPGWVEFHDGDTVLGHAAVSTGQAMLTTTGLAAGSHELTARFVPANSTDFQPSVSPPVSYQVTGTGTTSSTTTTTKTTTTTTTTTAQSGTATTTTTTDAVAPGTTTTSCVTTTQQAPADAVVLGAGHVDYGARIIGGGLSSQVKDDTQPGTTTWREPGRVVFHVVPAAATTVPASGFDFLGRPGERIWQIPQTQRAGILWLGWNTESITAAQARGAVSWSLDRVEGPGALAIFQFETFGRPQIIFNSGDGVPDRYEIPLGTHAHGNWVFTREGVYRVTFTHSVTLASGAQVRDTEVVTFAVGAVDPRSALPAGGQGGGGNDSNGACPGGPNAARLAFTGVTLGLPLAIGGLLVLAGALIVVIVRRRRELSVVDGER